VHAWELGNESNVFNCSSEATNITGAQMAASFIKVRSIIDEITPDSELWGPDPSLTGDVRGQCRSYWGADVTRYFEEVLEGAGRVIDKVTWHYYSQFQGDNTSSADVSHRIAACMRLYVSISTSIPVVLARRRCIHVHPGVSMCIQVYPCASMCIHVHPCVSMCIQVHPAPSHHPTSHSPSCSLYRPLHILRSLSEPTNIRTG